ncbi:MAG: FG-GAP repeat domain-containing protein [Planctomycetota bacterium]
MLMALLFAALMGTPLAAMAWPQDAEQDSSAADAEAWTEISARYGFSGLLNSKFNDGLEGLLAADVDGDGFRDLAVINNARARIELLLRREAQAGTEQPSRLNELPDEVNFRRESYPTEERVLSLAVADLNGDARGDLVFVGDSKRLSVALRNSDGGFAQAVRQRLSESPRSVHVANLDRDGHPDVVVLGRESTWVFRGREDGRLPEEPSALPNASPESDSLSLCDLNGDGHSDLLYARLESEFPFRWRLGRGDASFGPEITARFTAVRNFAVLDVDGDGSAEIAAIRRKSGRVALLRVQAAAAGVLALSEPQVVSFAPLKDASRRTSTTADLDGDGRLDVLVAEPGAARVTVHLAAQEFAPESFPSLLGASHPRLTDLDGDGRREVVLLAPDELAIGVMEVLPGGRLGFPTSLASPVAGDLLALDVAARQPGQPPSLWIVVADGKGRARKPVLLELGARGTLLGTTDLGELKVDPSGLRLLDLDRDGWNDALVTLPTESPRLLRGSAAGLVDLTTRELPGLGLLKGLDAGRLSHADIDGDGLPELLIPGPNFARAVFLDLAGVPQVVAQCNLPGSEAQAGVAGLCDLDADGLPELLVVDRSERTLVVFQQQGTERTVVARIDLGDLQPQRVSAGDVDGDGRLDVLLECDGQLAILRNGGLPASLVAELDYELPGKSGSLDRIALGDINGDGAADAVMTDTRSHRIAVAAIESDAICHALRFPIFEGRLFEEGRGGREPREVLVADVTGDGRQDIALLVHDRIIVYPQE